MNSKTDNPDSMRRLLDGLRQVNQDREQVPQGTAEETREARQEAAPSSPAPEQREEEIREEEQREEQREEKREEKRGGQKSKGKEKVQKEQFLFRVDADLLFKTRHISQSYGMSISEIMNYALKNFITSYEEKYGIIRQRTSQKISIDKLL